MTQKQMRLLEFIKSKVILTGRGPTYSEMKSEMGVKSNQTIGDILTVLESKGYIQINKGKLGGITTTKLSFVKKDNPENELDIRPFYNPSIGTTTLSLQVSTSNFINFSCLPSIINLTTEKGGGASGST